MFPRLFPMRIPALAFLTLSSPLFAQSAWNLDGAGSWGLASSWMPEGVPSGTGVSASLNFDLTANRTVTLDANRTVGTLTVGDPAAPYANFSLNAGVSGSQLIFDATGSSEALLHFPVADSAATNSLGAGITLLDNLEIRTASATIAAQSITGSMTGAFEIRKTGPGIVTLLGSSSTYSGGTRIEAGKLNVGRAASLGAGAVTVLDGGTLATSSTGVTFSSALNLSGLGCVDVATGARLGALRLANGNNMSGAVTLAAPARISAFGSTGTVSGVISGPHKLELGWKPPLGSASSNSGGTIMISGNNTHSGGTEVINAIVDLAHASALGTGPVTVHSPTDGAIGGPAQLRLADGLSFSSTLTLGENAGVATSGSVTPGALTTAVGATATWAGPINIYATPASGGHFGSSSTGQLILTGVIHGEGFDVLQENGTVVYSGAGTYTGLKVSGTARLGATNGLSQKSVLTLGYAKAVGTLDLNGFSQRLFGLQGDASKGVVTSETAAILTVQNTTDCVYLGAFSGPVSLVKRGDSTLTLGSSLPEGGLDVRVGKLVLTQATLPDTLALKLSTGAVVELTHGDYDFIASLLVDGTAQPEGLWGPVGSGAQHESPLFAGSGFLQVGAVSDPYLLWLQSYPALSTVPQKDREADVDGDGIPNLLEFLFGTGPTNPELVNPASMSSPGDSLIFTFPRSDAASSLNARVQRAPSPAGPWTNVTTGINVEDDPLVAGVDRVSVTVPFLGESELFLRLKVD